MEQWNVFFLMNSDGLYYKGGAFTAIDEDEADLFEDEPHRLAAMYSGCSIITSTRSGDRSRAAELTA